MVKAMVWLSGETVGQIFDTLAGKPGGTENIPTNYTNAKTDFALYDLEKDIGESTEVKDQFPEILAELAKLGEAKREELGDGPLKIKGSGVREAGRL